MTSLRSSGRPLALGALLLALAGGSWWLTQSRQDAGQRQPSPPNTPDYWIDGLVARTMDENGRPRRLLNAESMRHFPHDDSTELTRPELLLLEPGRPTWSVRSELGWVSPDGELVLLQGEVHIDREAAAGVRPTHLVTRNLRVQPKDEYAETDQPARLESGSHWVESIGLQVWLREPVRIKLLADVRGHYEVNAP
jgi:lipopolysaccharide export system protein LptC